MSIDNGENSKSLKKKDVIIMKENFNQRSASFL